MRAPATTLEDVDVVCTFCGVEMTSRLGSGAKVRYFRCGQCNRWVTSMYAEVFRGDTKVRRVPRSEGGARAEAFSTVKEKLDRWLLSLEDQDPYRVLGVSPLESPEAIR